MSTESAEFSMSRLSLNSSGSQEDWDQSETNIDPSEAKATTTPRNSVAFPAGDAEETPGRSGAGTSKGGKRSLSELLRLHAEKGTDCTFTVEEARRVADVLGQWINSGSSPYEGEDDFFSRDDSALSPRQASGRGTTPEPGARSRGQSESAIGSRPGSATGTAKA